MVCAGEPSSQRKRFGMANQTRPVATSGCVSVLSVRVCVKSADQVCRFVCAASQPLRTVLVSAALLAKEQAPNAKLEKNCKHQRPKPPSGVLYIECRVRDFIGVWTWALEVFPASRWERNDTIASHAAG